MNESKKCKSCNREYKTEIDFLTGTSRWRTCSSSNLWFNCKCGSTLIIPKGKYDWYKPEKSLGDDARSVFNSLGNLRDLPHIPAQVLEIQRLVNDSESSPKELGDAIKQDPICATQLLSIAENIRSSRNPDNAPIKTLEHAIVYLGVKSIADLILTSALKQFNFPKSEFNFKQFWHEAHLCGAIAEYFNANLNIGLNQDEVYLAGSMCNLGKLVTAYSFPEHASKIQADVSHSTSPVSWSKSESTNGFPDHRILGEISASLWGFPPYIVEVSHRHHAPLNPKKNFPIYELVAIANQLVHWVLLSPSRMDEAILTSFYAKTGQTESNLEALIKPLTAINNQLLSRSI